MPIIPNDTLSYVAKLLNRANSDSVVEPPLSRAAFTLDSSGVAGFFGGESAVRAMATVNLVPQRRWFGWYNAPGSYEVAKQYSALANSKIFDAIFPSDEKDPARILMVDGQIGPEHTLLYFPTNTQRSCIRHLGALIARKVSQMPVKKVFPPRTKHTMDARVAFVKLNRIPRELEELELFPSSSIIFTVGTILISVGGCIACALIADWFCFASIALGIIANGVACSVIGSGKLHLKNNLPSQLYSPGDVLLRSDTDITLLIGNEGSVSPFTRGRFTLRLGGTPWFGGPEHLQSIYDLDENDASPHSTNVEKPQIDPPIPTVHWSLIAQKYLIDISVILLLSQFLAQLLLIPQGTLFGQLMFIGTMVPSWMYHSYLSSLSLDFQTKTLFNTLSLKEKEDIHPYQFSTWTEAVVFACLVFRSIHLPVPLPQSSTTEDEQKRRKKDFDCKERNMATEMENVKQEVEVAKKKMEAARLRTEAAQAAQAAANLAVMIAELNMSAMAAKADAEKKQAEAQEDVQPKAETTKEAEERAEKMEKAAKKAAEAAEAAKVAGEVKKKAEKQEEAADARVKDAEKAAEERQAAAAEVILEKKRKLEEEERINKEVEKAKKQQEAENDAFQALVDALLPGNTNVWRAFKESLVRKLSAITSDSSRWDYMKEDATFEFKTAQDNSVSGMGFFTVLEGEDSRQLGVYQKNAENAFVEWRKVAGIAQRFRN